MPALSAEEVDALFEQGVKAGDVEAVVSLHEPTGTLVRGPGQVATGAEAIRAAIADLVQMRPKFSLQVQNVIMGGDVAAVHNDWSGAFTMPDGTDVEIAGKAIEICRKQADGTWRFVIDDPYARG